jgi:fatty-acid desaturase
VAGLVVAVWQAWDGLLRPSDLLVFAIVYVLTGLGVTVGFHRLLTHRSFKAGPLVRGTLAVLGSAAIEGPAISWVADHRKHHAFSDRPGDPHSPTSTMASAGRAPCADCCTPRGLAVSPRPARGSLPLRADLLATR